MSEVSRPERLQLMLHVGEIRAIDDWRFAHRMPSRAAAIRELLRLGLSVSGTGAANDHKHSTEYGVLGETSVPGRRSKGQ
jgi:hypothetical protein